MRKLILGLMILATLEITAAAQTPIKIEPVKVLKPTGILATCGYKPDQKEVHYFGLLSANEKTNDAALGGNYTIHGKTGTYVSWYGIVRGITPAAQPGQDVELLLQHLYFDGATDCHIMLVSKTGDGDFRALLKVDPAKIPALSLVRIYGKVMLEENNLPLVVVDYIRVWPWMTFTFTDLAGPDHSNPRWLKVSQVKPTDDIYKPFPDENYFRTVLGNPADFGLNLKPASVAQPADLLKSADSPK
jgi:hypothetical protein